MGTGRQVGWEPDDPAATAMDQDGDGSDLFSADASDASDASDAATVDELVNRDDMQLVGRLLRTSTRLTFKLLLVRRAPRICVSIHPKGNPKGKSCSELRYRFECLLSMTLRVGARGAASAGGVPAELRARGCHGGWYRTLPAPGGPAAGAAAVPRDCPRHGDPLQEFDDPHRHRVVDCATGRSVYRDGSARGGGHIGGRGLHSFTVQLNVSAFCGIGGALKGCLGGVRGCWGVLGGVSKV